MVVFEFFNKFHLLNQYFIKALSGLEICLKPHQGLSTY